MHSWKVNEYEVAKYFNGKRRPQHKYKQQGNDVWNEVAEIEVKTRKSLPKWMIAAYLKARSRSPLGRIPVIVLMLPDQSPEDALVLVSGKDLRTLMAVVTPELVSELSSPQAEIPSEYREKAKPKSRSKWPRRSFRKS